MGFRSFWRVGGPWPLGFVFDYTCRRIIYMFRLYYICTSKSTFNLRRNVVLNLQYGSWNSYLFNLSMCFLNCWMSHLTLYIVIMEIEWSKLRDIWKFYFKLLKYQKRHTIYVYLYAHIFSLGNERNRAVILCLGQI